MRKRGLKDVKRRNRQVIVESVIDNGSLSRTEISCQTELAPSTVSSLVGELLREGIFTEAGSASGSAAAVKVPTHEGGIPRCAVMAKHVMKKVLMPQRSRRIHRAHPGAQTFRRIPLLRL